MPDDVVVYPFDDRDHPTISAQKTAPATHRRIYAMTRVTQQTMK